MKTLTKASYALLVALYNDRGNWSGTPLFGGNVGDEIADKGNLTDLKKAGIIRTFREEGCTWVIFNHSEPITVTDGDNTITLKVVSEKPVCEV